MVDQHTVGLNATLRKSGCLYLCYLWAGWLWRAARNVGTGGKLGVPRMVDTVAWVNATFAKNLVTGDVLADATVIRPAPIIRTGGDLPDHVNVTVERRGADGLLDDAAAWALHKPNGSTGPFRVDVTEWTRGAHQHFVADCRAPLAYFDPWIASQCRQHGRLVGGRVVTIE